MPSLADMTCEELKTARERIAHQIDTLEYHPVMGIGWIPQKVALHSELIRILDGIDEELKIRDVCNGRASDTS